MRKNMTVEPSAKSKRAIAKRIIQSMDGGRVSYEGGYPSDYKFVPISGELFVAIATVSNNEPELIFMSVDDFIEEYKELLDEDDDDL